MGKPKNRDNDNKQRKDIRISIRTNKGLLEELREQTGRPNNTKAIEEAMNEYLKFKRNPESSYKCEECGNKILKQETYYCNLDQLEIRTDTEIIVTKGEPTKVLCLKCAKKHSAILEFVESEDTGEGDQVKESARVVK